jgi:hypothetical protein
MMDFATVPEALTTSGTTAAGAVQALHGADCWGPFAEVSAALPGANAATAAGSYGSAWTTYFTGWCAQAQHHADSLTASAHAYAATEQRNTTNLTGAGDGGIFGPGLNKIAEALG